MKKLRIIIFLFIITLGYSIICSGYEVAPGFKQRPIKGSYRVIEHNTEKTCWNICDTKSFKETKEGYILYPPTYCYIYINGSWDGENYFKPIETIYVKELTTIISNKSENKTTTKKSKKETYLKETYLKESCYQLGFRYGRCGAMVLKGHQCDPSDDIIIPVECRGLSETDKGTRDGVASVW